MPTPTTTSTTSTGSTRSPTSFPEPTIHGRHQHGTGRGHRLPGVLIQRELSNASCTLLGIASPLGHRVAIVPSPITNRLGLFTTNRGGCAGPSAFRFPIQWTSRHFLAVLAETGKLLTQPRGVVRAQVDLVRHVVQSDLHRAHIVLGAVDVVDREGLGNRCHEFDATRLRSMSLRGPPSARGDFGPRSFPGRRAERNAASVSVTAR